MTNHLHFTFQLSSVEVKEKEKEKKRMKIYNYIDKLTIIFIILILIYLSKLENEKDKKIKEKNKIENKNKFLKLKEKEKEEEEEGITIILNDYSSKIISNFLKEKNVKEIIIFNNNIKKKIKKIESNKIIIFNSLFNLKEYGIKIGCSLSKYKYCYYQNINWKNNYFKSSFKLFLKNKNRTLGILDKIYFFEFLKFGFLKKFKNFGIFFSKKNLDLNFYFPLILPLFHLKEGKYYKYKLKIKN